MIQPAHAERQTAKASSGVFSRMLANLARQEEAAHLEYLAAVQRAIDQRETVLGLIAEAIRRGTLAPATEYHCVTPGHRHVSAAGYEPAWFSPEDHEHACLHWGAKPLCQKCLDRAAAARQRGCK